MVNNLESNNETIEVNKNVVKDSIYYNDEQMIQITINYPSFDSDQFKYFTNYLNNYYYSKLVLHSKYEIYKLNKIARTEYEYAMSNNFPFRTFEYYVDFTITYNKNCTLSLYYDTYIYTGGAHGSTVKKSDTWDLKEGRYMSLTDYLVLGDNYRSFIIDEIISTIDSRQGSEKFIYFEDYNELVEKTFQKDSFYLTDKWQNTDESSKNNENQTNEGIVIYFQQYDIAPYVSGMPTFFIPFDNANVIAPSC